MRFKNKLFNHQANKIEAKLALKQKLNLMFSYVPYVVKEKSQFNRKGRKVGAECAKKEKLNLLFSYVPYVVK